MIWWGVLLFVGSVLLSGFVYLCWSECGVSALKLLSLGPLSVRLGVWIRV